MRSLLLLVSVAALCSDGPLPSWAQIVFTPPNQVAMFSKQMRKTAEAHMETYFRRRDAMNIRELRQAQSIFTQLLAHERGAGHPEALVDTLARTAEVSILLGINDTAEKLFSELLSLDACGPARKLGHQPSCTAFAGSKLVVLRRAALDDRGAEMAFKRAIERGSTWENSWQLPPEHLLGLTARAVWPAGEIPITDRLVSAYDDIAEDFQALEAAVKEGKLQWQATPDFFLLATGAWDEIMLKGVTWEDTCTLIPRTCNLLRGLREVDGPAAYGGKDLGVPGRVSFLRLFPGTELRPHTANWNGRLNVHLPIRVPPCSARCGGLTVGPGPPLEWRLREPLVFDDSFIHSAHLPFDSGSARVVLHVSVWHPELVAHTPSERPGSAGASQAGSSTQEDADDCPNP